MTAKRHLGPDVTWTTKDEIDFLKEVAAKRDHVGRLNFFQKYREAMSGRSRWGKIKRGEVRKYVDRRIKVLGKGGGG